MQVNPKLDQKECVCWTSVVELSQAWVLVKDLRDVNLFQGGVEKGGAALLLEKGVRTARRNLEVSRKLIHGEGGRCCAGTCAGTRIFPSLARYNTKRTGVRVLIPVLSRPVAAKKTRVPNPNGWSEHVRKAEQDKLLHKFKKKQKKKNFSFSFSFFYFLCGMCAYFAIFFQNTTNIVHLLTLHVLGQWTGTQSQRRRVQHSQNVPCRVLWPSLLWQ